MTFTDIKTRIKAGEGLRLKPYRDTVGVLTIGYGHNLEEGISRAAAEFIFDEDVRRAVIDLDRSFPRFRTLLDEARYGVLVEMVFNMGIGRFSGFKKMIAALDSFDFDAAAREMIDSKWSVQVGTRASDLAEIMIKPDGEGVGIWDTTN